MTNKNLLLGIAKGVLKECAPERLLKGAFNKKSIKKFDRVVVFAIGKAATGMAKAAVKMIGRKPNEVLLANEGHPLPTEKGVRNTRKIIKTARSLGKTDLAIVLISGGGSAMMTASVPEITLQDKIKTTHLLLKSGATINEMNVVRKHLSQVKGGNLAALLYPATVWGFVISDVVGNDLSTIASGPLTPDKTTFKDALKILKKYKIRAPKRVVEYLKKGLSEPKLETPKPSDKYFEKVKVKIVADHSTVLALAAKKARKLGLKVNVIKKPLTGECRDVAKRFVSVIASTHERSECASSSATKPQRTTKQSTLVIAGGETTVTCLGKGHGGRNQEFVLSGLRFLKPNQTLLSIGTDGVDGVCPEPIAGAIADCGTRKKALKLGLNLEKYLKNNDSYGFFCSAGGLIKTGPTGTNLGDLVLLLNR